MRPAVLGGVPLAFALFSVAMGRDANWDFLNYRWYDPWALLHRRLTFDVLVAGQATFYNPLLELPFFLIATHLSGMAAGFLLSLAGSLPFIPLSMLADEALLLADRRVRFAAASGISLAGLLGGGVLGQIGVVSWDLPLATPTLFSLWLLCRRKARALAANPAEVARVLLLAGALSGAAAGLKLTAAIYPLGIAAALVAASRGRARLRLQRSALFCVGAGAGVAACGGYWMWRLYGAFGNPVFPYFNDLFHSPFAATGNNRDRTFLPHGWHDALLFPYLFTVDSLRVAEYRFRDVHILCACVLAPTAALFAATEKSRMTVPLVAPFLFAFALVAFVAWEGLFAIYRYILPLEMLSSLLVVLAVFGLPLSAKARVFLAAFVLLVSETLTSVNWDRRPWDRNYVEIGSLQSVPPNATVLLTDNAPAAFALTALPATVPALKIGSYLAPGNRFEVLLHDRVAASSGPLLALFAPGDEVASTGELAKYGLAMSYPECQWVRSNVSDPLKLCPVSRK